MARQRQNPQRGGDDITTVEVPDTLSDALRALTGHESNIVGLVEVASASDEGPVKYSTSFYMDGDGHTHVEVTEWWPPDYHVGMVVADVALD